MPEGLFGRLIGSPRSKGYAKSALIIGLGRFGTAIARSLEGHDVEVMAVDVNPDLVNAWMDQITHVRVADATNVETLRQLGATGFDAAVVAIGSDMEASILATAALAELGVRDIWAKAITDQHARILELVGARQVVLPEQQMGQRVARIVSGRVLDYFLVDEGFALVEMVAPPSLVGMALGQLMVRNRFDVTVVCVKPNHGSFTYATADTVLASGDEIVVAGNVDKVEKFVNVN